MGIKEASVAVPENPVVFVCHGKATFVPDTNAYLTSLPCINSIMTKMARNLCHVAVPYQVQQELDGLQRNEDPNVRFQAREGLRSISTFIHIYSANLCQPTLLISLQWKVRLSDFFLSNSQIIFTQNKCCGLPLTDKKIKDDLIIKYTSKLRSEFKHSVVILTNDKTVYSKFERMTQSPAEYLGEPSVV